MRHRTDVRTIAQSAAFALFEGLRGARDLPLAEVSGARLTCVGAVDPTAWGLPWVRRGDAALQLEVVTRPGARPRTMFLHAGNDERGPALTVYMLRDRPALAVRFSGSGFVPSGEDAWRLRERPLFTSADALHGMREAAAKRLATAWDVPLDGAWLVVGEWDALEGAWDPDAVRRFAAIAWLLEAARGEGA